MINNEPLFIRAKKISEPAAMKALVANGLAEIAWPATEEQDMNEHTDFFAFSHKDGKTAYDVKSSLVHRCTYSLNASMLNAKYDDSHYTVFEKSL